LKEFGIEELRIGVFICDCGSNIAGHLDCNEITKYASTLPGVVFAKENLYTCSEAGILEIQNAIKEHHLNRVVVASCSPRTHQPLFQNACKSAGLNPYLFEMVNIRDQCSWVHMGERESATEKAKELVRMGVAKASMLEPQDDIETEIIKRVLVIGGGVAGLSAALSLSDMDLEVVLIEKERRLGGILNRLYKIAPELKDASEFVSSLIEKVKSKGNIRLFLESELKDMGGYIGNFDITISTPEGDRDEKVGSIVVATGADPLRPKGLFGYDGKEIITQIELEELLKKGKISSKRIVMIQCVGARGSERSYCSRICCMIAVKNAMILKGMNPDSQIHILYRDMQMYGTDKEKMLWDARGMGIRFEVYSADSPPEIRDKKVSFYQPIMGIQREIPFDLCVLSTPLIAKEGSEALSKILRIPMDKNGFFLEAHAKLRPLDFSNDGVFLCGSSRWPSTVEEAISQGMGAASRVASILFKDRLVTSAIVAEIDPQSCVGCKGCMDLCPYGAISYDKEKRICKVNEILCKGCGSCAAFCPSQSAQLKGFKPKQLFSQIRAVAQ